MPLEIPFIGSSSLLPAILLQLSQTWLAAPEPDFLPTSIRIGWTAESIQITAEITDKELLYKATADNQRLWELGDVFEVFIMPKGKSDYWELHVDPGNHRLHARFPGKPGSLLEDKLISPVGFHSETKVTETGWTVTIQIPSTMLGLASFEAGQGFRISCCRYDAGTKRSPVLSSSSPHQIPKFHQPQDWTEIQLVRK